MKPEKIKWALLGGGADSLIGIVHRIAAGMGDDYQLTGGVFTHDSALSQQFARDLGLDPQRTYADIDAMIAGGAGAARGASRVAVVTVATPNYLHYEMAAKLIQGGFHVICEKPVTATAAEAESLASCCRSRRLIFAVAHTYTGYPMVRQMRGMIAAGAIGADPEGRCAVLPGLDQPGDPRSVPGARRSGASIPRQGGQSCCIGDIGVHAFNLIEYTTGLRIQQALSDIDTLYPDNPLDVDGSVLLRLDKGIKGVLCASQIATAEENNLRACRLRAHRCASSGPRRIRTSCEFLQEGKPLSVLKPGHAYNLPQAREATKLPPGHPEGFFDAMGNIYRGVATAINGQVL